MRGFKVVWKDRGDEKPIFIAAATNSKAKLEAVKVRYGPMRSHYAIAYVRLIQSCKQWGGPIEECVNASAGRLRIFG